MSILHSIILGIIEGFTEFLPVSSTGHLILASDLLGLAQDSFTKTFEIVIQGGAILAVIVLYWKKFLDMEIVKKVLAAFVPTAIIGLVLYKLIKGYLIGNITVVLWALAIGGIILIIFEKIYGKKDDAAMNTDVGQESEIKALSYSKAALIGLAQAIAVIPGVSRSAATIVAGRMAGMSRAAIVEFSFLLAVPTILAATLYDLFKSLGDISVAGSAGALIVGFVVSFITAIFGIRFLLGFIKTKSFVGFGIYRIVIVGLFLIASMWK